MAGLRGHGHRTRRFRVSLWQRLRRLGGADPDQQPGHRRHHVLRRLRVDRRPVLRLPDGRSNVVSNHPDGFTRIEIEIRVSRLRFVARLETQLAPKSSAKFQSMLPLDTQIIQARWSGEAAWIPFGELDLDLGYENHTSYPAPGHLLLYPGGISETEILFPYGSCVFGSKMGQLAGNHFATIHEGVEHLGELGHLVLWKGAQEISFTQLAR